jgi:hypothetical protein
VVEILATEDDVVIDFIFGMLEDDRFVRTTATFYIFTF